MASLAAYHPVDDVRFYEYTAAWRRMVKCDGDPAMPTTTANGLTLYYEEHGEGDTLLLITGLGVDSRTWSMQVPALAQRFRTVIFDNRGSGHSGKPPGPYTVAQMAEDAAGLLD